MWSPRRGIWACLHRMHCRRVVVALIRTRPGTRAVVPDVPTLVVAGSRQREDVRDSVIRAVFPVFRREVVVRHPDVGVVIRGGSAPSVTGIDAVGTTRDQ